MPETLASPGPPVGPRTLVLTGLLLSGLAAFAVLGLGPRELWPTDGGWRLATEFFAHAVQPAWTAQSEDAAPLWPRMLSAALATAQLALAATSLAIGLGLPLGILASTSWWTADGRRRRGATVLYSLARGLIALMRSVHELLWAVLFLAALGWTPLSAVFAIAIPYAGVLAKIYSELLDEAPRDAAKALVQSGATRLQCFTFALLPRALPDMAAYSLYRFECAIRAAAVMGFFGFPTLGYELAAAFENLHFGEVWTALYTLFLLVISVDLWSGLARRSPHQKASSAPPKSQESPTIDRLAARRPRQPFAMGSGLAFGILSLWAWMSGGFSAGDFLTPRRLDNLERFLTEIHPFPLRDRPFDAGLLIDWLSDQWNSFAAEALIQTLAMSVAAIVLASALGAVASLGAARTLSTAEPFLPEPWPVSRTRRARWTVLVILSRGLLIFWRSVPEYIWAFLFLAMFGISAWPVVLALAIHNLGILAKLDAEVVEDLPPEIPNALRGLGASRLQVASFAILPAVLNRFLLFLFYRFETCVRESTVLGMLGVVSIGYWIEDARARQHYDTLFFLILLGSSLVLLADISSTWIRHRLRHSPHG